MKRLLAALAALLVAAMPVKAAKAADPFLTLDTEGPYHYGGTIVVSVHGTVPKEPRPDDPRARILLTCRQDGLAVYMENIDSPIAETPYVMHLGRGGGSSIWDDRGGGAADCEVKYTELGRNRPGQVFTSILVHVEA